MQSVLNFVRIRGLILLVGVAAELIYLLYFVRQFPLLHYYSGSYQDMGQIEAHSHPAFWAFVAAFALLFTLLGMAWWLVDGLDDRRSLWLVLGFGGLFATTLTFVYPITALDIFAYIDESLIMVQYHQNPIFVAPTSFPLDPLMKLSAGWGSTGAPYGPLGIVIDAIPTLFLRRNLLANLILLKLMFSAMLVACAYLAYAILSRIQPRYALAGALLIAWNPFMLFEISANGHNDIVMVFFLMLALLSVAEGELALGAVLLLASALTKYATLMLLPLFVLHGLARHQDWKQKLGYLAKTSLLGAALSVVAYVPFWRGANTIHHLLENQYYLYSFGSVLNSLFPGHLGLGQAATVGRFLLIPVYIYALSLASRELPDLIRACFITLFGFLALGATKVLYWYAVWPTTLAATLPSSSTRLAGFLMAYALELSVALNVYVWAWNGVGADSFRPINNVTYVLVFIVPAAVLVAARPIHALRPLSSISRRSSWKTRPLP